MDLSIIFFLIQFFWEHIKFHKFSPGLNMAQKILTHDFLIRFTLKVNKNHMEKHTQKINSWTIKMIQSFLYMSLTYSYTQFLNYVIFNQFSRRCSNLHKHAFKGGKHSSGVKIKCVYFES